jgi:hypothetical protein
MVELDIALILSNIRAYSSHSFAPWGVIGIAACLRHGITIYIESHNPGIGIALQSHKGNDTRACADIEYLPVGLHICPSAEKNTIRAHLHSAKLILYCKVLKTKHRQL